MTQHSASTPESEPVTDPHIKTRLSLDNPRRLPSYEEEVGFKDVSRLPSYRRSRPAPRRFHPYCRRQTARVNGIGIDRFMVRLPQSLVWIPFH